ncbi:nuclear transport factor 2 [Histomonas meleagridis]|uniref:nuclear transport factor 2 n=1 Tax=Histomonas meleagridis TaxID=135588 RepID=UPI00355A9930|nr:nuclear transport factor 2 [Histomonas meleagridis]KAH0803456.1 nuclear transport factor 2 [Histomonas meleagridis]
MNPFENTLHEVTEIARNFAQFYYGLYNDVNKRAQLQSLYTDQSCFTMQNSTFSGQQQIMSKLMDEGMLSNMKACTNFIAQPSVPGTILISVQGETMFQGEENTLAFLEIFLIGQVQGSFVILNQIFSTHGV